MVGLPGIGFSKETRLSASVLHTERMLICGARQQQWRRLAGALLSRWQIPRRGHHRRSKHAALVPRYGKDGCVPWQKGTHPIVAVQIIQHHWCHSKAFQGLVKMCVNIA